MAPPQKISNTLQELSRVSPDLARKTLDRLIVGYKDKSGSSYPGAVRSNIGCLIAMKTPNRTDNGYIQIAPIVETRSRVRKREQKKQKPKPQNAHRLVVIAHKSPKEVRNMIEHDFHASHRCHNPTCINPDHIVVETKDQNEARKPCKTNGLIVRFKLNSKSFEARPKLECNCEPSCIPRIEEREVIEIAPENVITEKPVL